MNFTKPNVTSQVGSGRGWLREMDTISVMYKYLATFPGCLGMDNFIRSMQITSCHLDYLLHAVVVGTCMDDSYMQTF